MSYNRLKSPIIALKCPIFILKYHITIS